MPPRPTPRELRRLERAAAADLLAGVREAEQAAPEPPLTTYRERRAARRLRTACLPDEPGGKAPPCD